MKTLPKIQYKYKLPFYNSGHKLEFSLSMAWSNLTMNTCKIVKNGSWKYCFLRIEIYDKNLKDFCYDD